AGGGHLGPPPSPPATTVGPLLWGSARSGGSPVGSLCSYGAPVAPHTTTPTRSTQSRIGGAAPQEHPLHRAHRRHTPRRPPHHSHTSGPSRTRPGRRPPSPRANW